MENIYENVRWKQDSAMLHALLQMAGLEPDRREALQQTIHILDELNKRIKNGH